MICEPGRMDGVTQSVELLLDDEQDAAVRRQWLALQNAGLPSRADQAGEINRPHLTLSIAGQVPAYLETALKAAFTGRVPIPVRLGGLVCFPAAATSAAAGAPGAAQQVLARLVVPSSELLELQATCAELFDPLPGTSPRLQPGAWSPHVTLARRLPTAQVSAALAALGRVEESTGAGVEIRRWNSETRTAWLITRARPAQPVEPG
jgi:2'-5' RNA ligase